MKRHHIRLLVFAVQVKAHKFFSTINWDDLLRKNIPAPFIPKITSTMDVSNFSEEFTNMPVVDSPSVAPSANATAVAPDAAAILFHKKR